MERYYISNKRAVLLDVYGQLSEAARKGKMDSEEYNLRLQQDCGKYNLSMLVLNEDLKIVKSSESDSNFMKLQLLQHVFMRTEVTDEIEKTEQYVMQRVEDPRSHMEYIEVWGILENRDFFIIRTALEGIQDSVQIANRFLAYVGMLAAVASGLIIWYVSGKVTTPILLPGERAKRSGSFGGKYQYAVGDAATHHFGVKNRQQ